MGFIEQYHKITGHKISILPESNDQTMVFLVEGLNLNMAKKLRKIIYSQVPTFSIYEVEVFKNSSVLCDELLAHRLGLIPLLNLSGDENIDIENVFFTLNIKGDKDRLCIVKSGDLISNDDQIIPANSELILLKLLPDQEISLQCSIKKGTGSEHSKWIPVCGFNYEIRENVNTMKITIETIGSLSPQEILLSGMNILLQEKN